MGAGFGRAAKPYRLAVGWFGCQTIDSILLPDTRQPAPFVGAQKGRKSAFSAYAVAANEIAGDFDAAVRVEW